MIENEDNLSLYLFNNEWLTTSLLRRVVKACGGPALHSISLKGCQAISDIGVIILAEGCPGLKYINPPVSITDYSLISLANNCSGLREVDLSFCQMVTDVGLMMISEKCTGLQND